MTPAEQTQYLYQQARVRVESDPQLQPYADIIFADWTEGDEHLEWVGLALTSTIVAWAEEIRQAELSEHGH